VSGYMQINFFAETNRLDRLSKMGDPLEKMAKHIDFEIFRLPLVKLLELDKKIRSNGGRPPMDCVLMWKIVLLQQWYGISNDSLEYQINDRLSFQRFLGLGLSDKVPDANTLWDFKEALAVNGGDRKLFDMFEKMMEEIGVITRSGSLVDASFVDAPRQRNSRDDNKKIKEGEIPEEWTEDTPEAIHKLSQKDTDARWTKKNNETHYGYKDHVKVDKDSKMIVGFSVTDASVHDSQEIVGLIDENDEVVYADSAYIGDDFEAAMRAINEALEFKIIRKGFRNNPLSEEAKLENKEKSRVRVRVEHVFGHMTIAMGGMIIRTIGITRATAEITRKNLAYNLQRYVFLASRPKPA